MNDVKDWSVTTTRGDHTDTITEAAQAPAKAAQQLSNTLESGIAQEPVNSTFRTALMGLAGLSVATSLVFQIMRKKDTAVFVGQWAPTLLLIALWGQVAKTQERPRT